MHDWLLLLTNLANLWAIYLLLRCFLGEGRCLVTFGLPSGSLAMPFWHDSKKAWSSADWSLSKEMQAGPGWDESALCIFEFFCNPSHLLEIALHSCFDLKELLFEFDFRCPGSRQPSSPWPRFRGWVTLRANIGLSDCPEGCFPRDRQGCNCCFVLSNLRVLGHCFSVLDGDWCRGVGLACLKRGLVWDFAQLGLDSF